MDIQLNHLLKLLCIALLLAQSQSTYSRANTLIPEEQTIPVKLRCEYMIDPFGIEKMNPNLSWQTNTTENNWLQSAYQIIVATDPKLLTEKDNDVWNSGKVLGGESVGILYNGPKLISQQKYYWKVRVWDTSGQPSAWSEPAHWEMAILNKNDWTAKWISHIDNSAKSDRDDIRWVWLPDQDPTDVPRKTVASFQVKVNIKELPMVATMQTSVRGNYGLSVNGIFVDGKKKTWQLFERQDILGYLKTGENIVEVRVESDRTASFVEATGNALIGNYAVFAGLLKIEDKDGTIRKYPTSEGYWMSKNQNEDEWKTAKVVGELNDPRFGVDPGPLSESASLFRKEFKLKKVVESARLYVTALGSYRMFINGNRVGNNILTPEFTNYNERITYQTYDITSLLNKTDNVVGSMLGDGWYGSPLGWNGEYDLFGSTPNMLLAEIHIRYKDGTKDKIITDESWKAHRSPVLKSEIYSGEYYDARLEQDGWNAVRFNDKGWENVNIMNKSYDLLSPQANEPIKVTQTIKPVTIRKTDDQKWIIDMGQNLVGWIKLNVKGESGTVVKTRFAEILDSDGNLYTDNLRNATATNTYVLKGKGTETYTPHFTFQGFRYVEISGYPGQLSDDAIVAEVISSVDKPTGFVQTSSSLVNSMYSLGIWGQLGNFISVPTDCPQRDERLGYTGDGQVFWRTGTYNFDIASFTHKWMKDILDEQTKDGGFTNTAPAVPKNNRKNGAPGWEDAGVIVPWSTWMQYGDKSIILENWQAMSRYMDYVERQSEDYIRPGGRLGDWLGLDNTTPNQLISTGLWAMTAEMMSQMAIAIGKTEEAVKYSELRKKIQAVFQEKFISSDGKIGSGSQTSYVIALHTGMVPESLKKVAVEKLVEAIEAKDWHLSTGFLGTPYLLFALSENGRADVAYRLLLNETYPSWGYMIKKGATTWWERWNSDTSDPTMNSHNHYAFGSVVEWVYRSMAGINTDPERPGFKNVIISPIFDRSGKITQAKGKYDSVYGEIVSEWVANSDNTATLKIKIPANTTAKIVLPAEATFKDKKTTLEIGSGSYEFIINL